MIGNLKESALPYLLEQMRLAKLSFDLWGALSPTVSRNPPGSEENQSSSQTESEASPNLEANAKRSISQAELESSLYKVSYKTIN